MNTTLQNSITVLQALNPHLKAVQKIKKVRTHALQKVLVCNRGEIAKRAFLCLREEGIPTVAVVTSVDMGQSFYELADEHVLLGDTSNYINHNHIIAAMLLTGANGLFPGYGFLAENADFVSLLAATENQGDKLIFMGPNPNALRILAGKYQTLELAKQHGIPIFAGSPILKNVEEALEAVKLLEFPVMVKINTGGGGKGMAHVYNIEDLKNAVESCQRLGSTLYKDTEIFLEEFIEEPAHFEVQIFNKTPIGIRKCAVQRRNQKIIEETGEAFLDRVQQMLLFSASEKLAQKIPYDGCGSGTVEFLFNPLNKRFGLLEVNPRIQVEHPVTEQALDIDIVKWQIMQFDGREKQIPISDSISIKPDRLKHAIECRLYAEDPENDYSPSPGPIKNLILPTFNGARCDMGFRPGDRIVQEYDPMIGKIIATGKTRKEALIRMSWALNETYISGVQTNIAQLSQIVNDERFKNLDYTNRLVKMLPAYGDQAKIRSTLPTAAICGAFDSYLTFLAIKSKRLIELFKNMTADLQQEPAGVVKNFEVSVYGDKYAVEFNPSALDTFVVYLNGDYYGEIQFKPMGPDHNWMIIKGDSYSVRTDKRQNYTLVRLKSTEKKVAYYKMAVEAVEEASEKNPPGLMRVPFSSRFVKFCISPLARGSRVEKGQPLVVIEAMKMESTLLAPVSGTVERIIEDGDLTKLQLSVTPEGQVIGKALTEGQFLVLINEEVHPSSESTPPAQTEIHVAKPRTDALREHANPDKLLLLAEHVLLGFIENENAVKNINDGLRATSQKFWENATQEQKKEFAAQCLKIVNIYVDLQLLFSFRHVSDLSYYSELMLFMDSIGTNKSPASASFKIFLSRVFGYYNLHSIELESLEPTREHGLALLFLHQAHINAQQRKELVKEALLILCIVGQRQQDVDLAINRLIDLASQEQDDSLVKIAKQVHPQEPVKTMASSKKTAEMARFQGREAKSENFETLIGLELATEEDERKKLESLLEKQDPKNLLLYKKGKWNIEIWAEACFDDGKFEEIKISSIDAANVQVGSKIFRGQIASSFCYFYCKDSRIKGGATGHLEGMKYVAACFLAYIEGVPLFIFNDGAGANIKEGVVALNRAAEGFMMNTLLTQDFSEAKIIEYLKGHTNKDLKPLWDEASALLTTKFGVRSEASSKWRGLLVAVGIGSSTGLDVYGSSQTTLQIMLDSDVSYRVLTGSKVIESVMGETFSNYEIGGAKMMGRFTGIVDLVAKNKLDLVEKIRDTMKIFGVSPLERASYEAKTHSGFAVLSEEMIRESVEGGQFLELKGDFTEAEAVLGGLARLNGIPVLILGPRNSIERTNSACDIKCRELLELAYKARCPQILVFARDWSRPKALRSASDISDASGFFETLHHRKGTRIHIVLHSGGLQNFVLNQSADFVILVEESPNAAAHEHAAELAHFTVKSAGEAFALAGRLLALTEKVVIATANLRGGKQPILAEASENVDRFTTIATREESRRNALQIPADHSQPYDVIANVIDPTFDAGTFIEVHQNMNDPLAGPALVTGLARLHGQSVAIIADQPKIIGGAADSKGTEKFKKFVEFAARRELPLIMLSSAPGFLPGIKQERQRIQAIGAESLDANIKNAIPVVSVVLNKNFGGRLIQAFSKFLRPGIVYLAMDKSILAVMGPQASFDLFGGPKYQEMLNAGQDKEAASFRTKYFEDFNKKSSAEEDGIKSGLVDWIIPMEDDLSEHLVKGLEMAKKSLSKDIKSPQSRGS